METRNCLVILALLAGCTVIGHEKVEGWPKLNVVEHYVPHAEMRDHCVGATPWWGSPEACADINLLTETCDLWFSADFPPQAFIVKHERMHCDGYDHVGDTQLKDHLQQWQKIRPRLNF